MTDPSAPLPAGADGHVVIIGGGFAGALQAVNLLRHGGPRATLIERRPRAGRGVAYSTAHPDHLLNVRATSMSALADDPQHFVRWLDRHHPEHSSGFVPRLVYGDYLSDLLAEAATRSAGRLTILAGDAIDVAIDADGALVTLDDGRCLRADTVVLAPGNLPPHDPPGLDPAALAPGVYAPDPWSADIAADLAPDDVVLTIGSGLTMVDVALLLEARGFTGRIVALSRRGLLPLPHSVAVAAGSSLPERPDRSASALLRSVRVRAAAVGWRAAVDELRPYTQSLWGAATLADRRRFLRHLRPWWDIHRHRLAPQVATRIAALQAAGRLEVVAGKLVALVDDGTGLMLHYRARGADHATPLRVRRIVNCTGPQGDILRTAEPLLKRLLERGYIRPDPLHIGIDVNQQSEVVGHDGRAVPQVLALGPMTRGSFWEIVAVPDIRQQTWSVARRLSNAHWVGGEGL